MTIKKTPSAAPVARTVKKTSSVTAKPVAPVMRAPKAQRAPKPPAKSAAPSKAAVPPRTTSTMPDVQCYQGELAELRKDFKAVLAQFALKVQGHLMMLEEGAQAALAGEGPSVTDMAEALALLSEMKLKPKKGRLKDIQQVVEVVKKLKKLMKHTA